MLSRAWDLGEGTCAILGPGSIDPIFQVYFSMDETQRGVLAHHNLQSISKKGEKERVEYYYRQQNLPTTYISSTMMDGDVWKMEKDNVSLKNQVADGPLSFIPAYQKAVHADALKHTEKGKSPSHFIDDKLDITNTDVPYSCAADAFYGAWEGNPFVVERKGTDHGQVELGQMMQLGVQGFIALAEIHELKAKYPGLSQNKFIKLVCKQLIDRGAVMTVLARFLYLASENEVFQKMMTKDDLTAEDQDILHRQILEIAGVLMGRAYLVEQRMPLKERYEPLIHLIEFFGHNPQALLRPLADLREQCQGNRSE